MSLHIRLVHLLVALAPSVVHGVVGKQPRVVVYTKSGRGQDFHFENMKVNCRAGQVMSTDATVLSDRLWSMWSPEASNNSMQSFSTALANNYTLSTTLYFLLLVSRTRNMAIECLGPRLRNCVDKRLLRRHSIREDVEYSKTMRLGSHITPYPLTSGAAGFLTKSVLFMWMGSLWILLETFTRRRSKPSFLLAYIS